MGISISAEQYTLLAMYVGNPTTVRGKALGIANATQAANTILDLIKENAIRTVSVALTTKIEDFVDSIAFENLMCGVEEKLGYRPDNFDYEPHPSQWTIADLAVFYANAKYRGY